MTRGLILTGTIISSKKGSVSNDNDYTKEQNWILTIKWFNAITRTLFDGVFPSAERQSAYSTVQDSWAEPF